MKNFNRFFIVLFFSFSGNAFSKASDQKDYSCYFGAKLGKNYYMKNTSLSKSEIIKNFGTSGFLDNGDYEKSDIFELLDLKVKYNKLSFAQCKVKDVEIKGFKLHRYPKYIALAASGNFALDTISLPFIAIAETLFLPIELLSGGFWSPYEYTESRARSIKRNIKDTKENYSYTRNIEKDDCNQRDLKSYFSEVKVSCLYKY